jgi:hypothetical protein
VSATEDLVARHQRPAMRIAHLRLTAAGLCAAELQQEWLPSERMRAAEPAVVFDATRPRRSPRGISGRHQQR